jgi:hypothetical protein
MSDESPWFRATHLSNATTRVEERSWEMSGRWYTQSARP